MKKYHNLHWWLMLPFVIVVAGFTPSYWSRFGEASFAWHLHGLSATLWYVLLIVQPWLATRGKIKQHRRLGMAGILLAGMVAGTALVRIPANITASKEVPMPWLQNFLYGISLFDLLSIMGFIICVIIGVWRAKKRDDHEMWMISTVFWSLMAGLARLGRNMVVSMRGPESTFNILDAVFWFNLPMMAVMIFICYRLRNWHPAMLAAMAVNLLLFFIEPIGQSLWWRHIADALFKS